MTELRDRETAKRRYNYTGAAKQGEVVRACFTKRLECHDEKLHILQKKASQQTKNTENEIINMNTHQHINSRTAQKCVRIIVRNNTA